MKVRWILESNHLKEKSVDRLFEELEAQHIPYEIIPSADVAFAESLPPIKPVVVDEACVLYGSTEFLKRSLVEYDLYPGVWFNEDVFKTSTWGPKLGDRWLQSDSIEVSIKYASRYIDRPMFVRPVNDLKLFSGEVMDPYDFQLFYTNRVTNQKSSAGESIDEHTRVLLSEPRAIIAEWRFLIAHGAVVTSSQYMKNGRHIEEFGCVNGYALDLAIDIARMEWQPELAYIVDICQIGEKKNCKVIEINCFNASGLYEMDIPLIVSQISETAIRDFLTLSKSNY